MYMYLQKHTLLCVMTLYLRGYDLLGGGCAAWRERICKYFKALFYGSALMKISDLEKKKNHHNLHENWIRCILNSYSY